MRSYMLTAATVTCTVLLGVSFINAGNSDSLSHFNRTVSATLDLSLGLLSAQPSISNAEECARQCLDTSDFTCRSFIFNEV